MLNKEEISRYSRHLLLPEIGVEGQEKLKKSRVLVIGAGGLGCPVLLYLTAVGVGEIGIVDFDTIDESNLQRQILYSLEDVGESKAIIAKEKLHKQNPLINIFAYNTKLSTQNALDIIKCYDIIVDGTDNYATRYLVNDACTILNKPLVYGSIYRFEGQVSVFNSIDKNGIKGPNYRCLFPTPPAPESSRNCTEIGVLGILPGIIGTMQANEVIKLITGTGESLSGKLLLVNTLTMAFNTIEIQATHKLIENVPTTAMEFMKTDYDFFCMGSNKSEIIKNITVTELFVLLEKNENLQLLDVREPEELPKVKELKGLQIPLGDIKKNADKISRTKKVIVICKSGVRSKRAIELLQNEYGFDNLYDLDGGVLKWTQEYQKNIYERK